MRGRARSVLTGCYRGAILFDQRLPWIADDHGHGYSLPGHERRLHGSDGNQLPGPGDVRRFFGCRLTRFYAAFTKAIRGIQFGSPYVRVFQEPFHEHATCLPRRPGRPDLRDRRDGIRYGCTTDRIDRRDAALAGDDRTRGVHGLHDPSRGRERRRQRAGCTPDPRIEPAARRPVHRDQLRRARRDAGRGGVVRHRGAHGHGRPRTPRQVRGGRSAERCFSTRSRTCLSRRRPSCSERFRTSRSSASAATARSRVDIRIIAATNRSLLGLVEQQLFRADLYYRLSGVDVFVPALRERRDDIAELASYFLERHRSTRFLQLSAAAAEALVPYHWPGNVRELERLIERTVALCRSDVIELDDLPASDQRRSLRDSGAVTPPERHAPGLGQPLRARRRRPLSGQQAPGVPGAGDQLSHAADVLAAGWTSSRPARTAPPNCRALTDGAGPRRGGDCGALDSAARRRVSAANPA